MRTRNSKYYAPSSPARYEHLIDGKPDRGTWFEPGWRATTTGGAILLSLCLVANIVVLIWASVRPGLDGAPKADDNPVLVDGSCDQVNAIKTWSHLAINIVSTLPIGFDVILILVIKRPFSVHSCQSSARHVI